MKKRILCFVLSLFAFDQARAQGFDAARAFGAREDIEDVSLSPDGNHVSFVAPTKGQGNALFTVNLAGDKVPHKAMEASGKPERITGCEWVSNRRLACSVYGVIKNTEKEPAGFSRYFAVNDDGSNLKMISTRQSRLAQGAAYYGGRLVDLLPGEDGNVLMSRLYIPEGDTSTLYKNQASGLGVDRVNTESLVTKRVVSPDPNGDQYWSDGLGHVRVGSFRQPGASGYLESKLFIRYKSADKQDWLPLSEYDLNSSTGFYPVAVDPTQNAVYGVDNHEGRKALFRISLDGSKTKTLVYSHPQVDVDGPTLIGRKRRIVGVTFATEKRYVHYFDPAIEKLTQSLSKAVPGLPTIYVMGASEDEQKMIIYASSDTNPGQYFHLDRTTRALSPLFPAREGLEGTKLAEMKPVTFKAADGTPVPAYLTLPPGSSGKGLPAIVMPHGGPSARDEWGFDWLSQYFANRGYAVIQPNFRGSDGYGNEWFEKNGFQSWVIAIGDIADSGRWLVSQGIADPKKLAVFGWSYGGYAALQSGVAQPDLFKAIVAVAPVTDLPALKQDHLYWDDYRIVSAFVGSGPHLKAGSPAQNADKFKAPVLMFHGDMDLNVDIGQSRLMEGRLKSAGKQEELVVFKGLDHYLQDSDVRATMLSKSDVFLRQSMGLPPAP